MMHNVVEEGIQKTKKKNGVEWFLNADHENMNNSKLSKNKVCLEGFPDTYIVFMLGWIGNMFIYDNRT